MTDVKSKKQYTVSIIDYAEVRNINLDDFKKTKITFGRKKDNDIVLNSPIVSAHHGYFLLDENGISVYDNNSKNGIFINNTLLFDGCKIGDNDTIKIDNPMLPLNDGVLMSISEGKNSADWTKYELGSKDVVVIGRNKDCDIVLNRVSVESQHAKIIKRGSSYYLDNYNAPGGIIIDNNILTEEIKLRDKDLFVINNIKLIYNNDVILYQERDQGVKIEAIDIVKTVRIKMKKRDIAQHINFTANPGEFIAFVGGSGAGKSTFLKCISGVTKPTSGKVLLNGSDLYNNYSSLKNLIGYVPQDNIIYNELRLIDMLKYAANIRMPDDATQEEKEKRIEEVLEIVELSDRKDTMIKSLSGGQQKRACIAVELIADPKLLFMDEPTSGLDPGTERSLMKTLRRMSNSGKTVILVTHNTLNLHLCDKVVFFGYGGKLCFDGKPSDSLEFFKVKDFVDVYGMITKEPDKWRDEFAQSKYVQKMSQEISSISNQKIEKNDDRKKGFFKQFITLVRRKFKMLFNNKQQLILLFGQAPLLGYLTTLVVTGNIFYSYEETKSILFILANSSIWIGLLNSITEICKEKTILSKEYMADLRLSSYIASKLVYLIIIGLVQALLLVASFSLFLDGVPPTGIVTSWFIETSLIVLITIISSSCMGLIVSAFAKDSATAMTIPAILLVPQMLFSGILFPLDGIVEKLSGLMICRWSTEALGTVNNLNELISEIEIEVANIPGADFTREFESIYEFTIEHLNTNLLTLCLMAFIFIMISYFILKIQLESEK